jgi:hypothetical protein
MCDPLLARTLTLAYWVAWIHGSFEFHIWFWFVIVLVKYNLQVVVEGGVGIGS